MRHLEPEAIADDLRKARNALGRASLCLIASVLLLPPILRFEVDFFSFWPLAVLALAIAAFIPYASWRKMWTIRAVLELSAISQLSVLAALVITYASMRFNMPIADPLLIAMDRAIGFDWPSFVRFVDQSALAANLLEFGYGSLMSQLLFLPGLLCLLQFQVRAYRFMLALLLFSMMAAIICIPFPALGAYVGHGLDGSTLRNIDAHFGYAFLESFNAVRESDQFVLTMGNAAGIVTFPSGHVGFAVLAAWAAWPSRWLRLPVLGLNILMVVSSITNGAHYLVDVIAGGAVAALAIWMAVGNFGTATAFRHLARAMSSRWPPAGRSPGTLAR